MASVEGEGVPKGLSWPGLSCERCTIKIQKTLESTNLYGVAGLHVWHNFWSSVSSIRGPGCGLK